MKLSPLFTSQLSLSFAFNNLIPQPMPYSISKTQRLIMILCVIALIFEMLYSNSVDWFTTGEPDMLQYILLKILHVTAYGILMFLLFDYFRHYQLKVLKTTTVIIVLTEIAGIIISAMHHVYQVPLESMPAFNKTLLTANSFLWNVALFIWIIFLFLVGRKNYPPLFSLQKYGLGILLLFLLGGMLPLLFKVEDFPTWFRVINFASALNYLFLIEFSLKIPLIKPQP